MTMVWLHSQSPPQHIANVYEGTISTSAKLRTYMEQVNANRLVNLKWGGAFENERGEVSVHLFWDEDKAHAYVERNAHRDDLLISTED